MSEQETVFDELDEDFAPDGGGRPRGLLVALLAVVVVAALAAGAWFLFLAGDDVDGPEADVPAAQPADDEDAPDAPVEPQEVVEESPLIEAVEVFLTRDPFRPVRPEDAPPPPPDGTDPPPPPDDNGDPAPDPKDEDDRRVISGQEVEIIDVFTEDDGTRRVVVRVNSATFTVGEGDTFAEHFRVLSIDPPCATFLHGDNQFTLCEGERVLK